MDKGIITQQLKVRFGISRLNEMQNSVIEQWLTGRKNIVLYSPTGSGKTLAFAVPILRDLNETCVVTKVVVIEPTRELVLQTTEVFKKLAPTIKTTPCYGGHNSQDERQSLSQTPVIVVATPGRLLDHIEHRNISTEAVDVLVLDEFDKSLELGFRDDMRRIIQRLPSSLLTMMTSATVIKNAPSFIDLSQFETVNFLQQDISSRITTCQVRCGGDDRLRCLANLVMSIPDERTIVFVNQRDTAQLVYRQLVRNGIKAGLYVGTLKQSEREKVMSMFRNGSLLVLVSTDLGGRGIDISDIKHIIHYEQPLTSEIYTHRNGRTARVDASGEVYVITGSGEPIASFITIDGQYNFSDLDTHNMKLPTRATIYISAGKKEKISRGDIVGYFLHNCPFLTSSEIAGIDIYDHYTLIGVPSEKAEEIIKTISPYKLKKLKVKLAVVGFRPEFI